LLAIHEIRRFVMTRTAIAALALLLADLPSIASAAQQTSGPDDQGFKHFAAAERNIGAAGSAAITPSEEFAAALTSGAVKEVQQALNREGPNAGPADGVWSERTAQALRTFQSNRGLNATGRLDRRTAEKLGLTKQASGYEPSTTGKASNNGRR
jgi:murein L,D-transpeptidase YcbB/YkuD